MVILFHELQNRKTFRAGNAYNQLIIIKEKLIENKALYLLSMC
jgi:hypothetical protein